jgi:regulator of protease activity HflC (stomatin/prohibitin superfamily)
MKLFAKKVSIKPNYKGFIFRDNAFVEELNPGVYEYSDFFNTIQVVEIPTTSKLVHVTNQEVLTKDNIALRFSFAIYYRIENGLKYMENFNVFNSGLGIFFDAENLIRTKTQVYLRERISMLESASVNENREILTKNTLEELGEKLNTYGVSVTEVLIIDVTFPKMIQDLFSKELEAKIRAKSDLENARTAVATVRTLKNAADMIKQNEEVKFIQILETVSKIAEKGKHTFHFGEFINGQLMK